MPPSTLKSAPKAMIFKPQLSFPFNIVNYIGRGAVHYQKPSLDPDLLLDRACRHTGLSDYGDDYFREGLHTLLRSATTEANLTFIGRIMLQSAVLNGLRSRLLLVETEKREPAIFNRLLYAPLIVCGFPRSGTTYLHRLLALDSNHYAPLMWELQNLIPPINQPDRRFSQAERKLKMYNTIAPHLKKKHLITATKPEECIFMLAQSFRSNYLAAAYPVPAYDQWLLECDHHPAYHDWGKQLQYLQHGYQRPLVLKAPQHFGHLDALLAAVPQAQIVQTHRDPVTILHSRRSLMHSTFTVVSQAFDLTDLEVRGLAMFVHQLHNNLQTHTHLKPNVVNVAYHRLRDDPIGVVKQIYTHFALPWSEEFEAQLHHYIDQNPQHKFGKHLYHQDRYAVSDEAIRTALAPYWETYGRYLATTKA